MTLHSESPCKSSSIMSPPLSTPHTLMWLKHVVHIPKSSHNTHSTICAFSHFLPSELRAFTLHLKQLNAPNQDHTKVRYTTFPRGGRVTYSLWHFSPKVLFSPEHAAANHKTQCFVPIQSTDRETLTRAIPPQPLQQQSGSMCFLLHIIFHHGLLIHGFSLTPASMKFVFSKAVTKISGSLLVQLF